MLPDHVLSTTNMPGYFLPPDDIDPRKVVDYELGGVGIQDASQGLEVQVWIARLDIDVISGFGTVWLSAPNTASTVLFSRKGVTEISLAFDQNMNPFIAFMEFGQGRFWWFDTVPSAQVFSDLPLNSHSPKACLDDKRVLENSTRDIILGYVRNDILYYREQRDRFTVEYQLALDVTMDLIRVGMGSNGRLQFAVGTIEDDPVVTVSRVTVAGNRRVTVNGDVRRIVGAFYG